ncbi:hypothetical protein B0H11DRAFT_2298156 [Mycena galericulata]|nr:hypothetical protein B0H11DRAFT_2298156 [Mycena galericulata]
MASKRPPAVFLPQMPLRAVPVETYDSDDEDVYYCPRCDPCPICDAPPKPACDAPPAYTHPAADGRPTLSVPISLPIMIFLFEAYFLGGWRQLTAVADMALALALTDDGPDVTQQPSKLFTSRAEFQRTRAPHNPTSFTPIPITEAERSIQALLTNPPTAKKPNKCDRRPLEVLAELGRKLEGANKNLDIEQSFDMDDNEQTTRMRTEVNAASEVALSVEKTLQRVRDCSEKELELPYRLRTTPLRYDASYITDNPIERLDLIAQVMILLGIVCHVIIGLGTDPTNFVLQTVMLLIKLVMSLHSSKTPDGKDAYDAQQKDVLEQLPSSLYVAMQQFQYRWEKRSIPSYPSTCDNSILDKSGRRICGTELLTTRNADPEIERLCDKTCDDAFASSKKPPPSHSTNVFDSTFLREFEGPVPGRLFVDRGDKMRLPFTVFFDCFNPNGTRKRGNHDSIGIFSAACLLLPEEIRYKPEYLYKCIVNGPKEPSNEEISGYLGLLLMTP